MKKIKCLLQIFIFFLITICILGCTSTSTSSPTLTPTRTPIAAIENKYELDTDPGLIYVGNEEENEKLDIYYPDDEGNWPVVIVVHGYSQDSSHFTHLSEAIASQGAVVYNINVEITVPWIKTIHQIACAVRYARETASNYNGNPGWITLVGSSAGAANGVIVAMDGDQFGKDCVVSEGSALVDAFVGYEGPYNIATYDLPERVNHSHLEDEDPELWHLIDPYYHIGENIDLKILLLHGIDGDKNWYDVKPAVSQDFYQALKEAGYDVEFITIDGAYHRSLTTSFYVGFPIAVQEVITIAQISD
jgi:acetyl esterase/lipase